MGQENLSKFLISAQAAFCRSSSCTQGVGLLRSSRIAEEGFSRHQKEIIMGEHTSNNSASVVLTNLGKLLPDLEPLYRDIHAHPELSMHETRTAGIAADKLRKAGYEVRTGGGQRGGR